MKCSIQSVIVTERIHVLKKEIAKNSPAGNANYYSYVA